MRSFISIRSLCCIAVCVPNTHAELLRGSRSLEGLGVPTEVPIVGAVTTTSAVVGFRTNQEAWVKIKYATNERFTPPMYSDHYVPTKEEDDYTGKIELEGLAAAQKYWYLLIVDGVEHPKLHDDKGKEVEVVQTFETFPEPGNSVRISVFSDAANHFPGARAKAYESASVGATLALQIGDFDHSDPKTLADHRLMHRGLRDIHKDGGRDAAEWMFTKMAVAHVYDDHDFCGKASDKTCSFKDEALKAYDEYYPTYERPNPSDGIYHKFTIGDAEIFMLDTRFGRTPAIKTYDAKKTMLGSKQKEWLKSALRDSSSAWKIIVSTVTTNKHARPGNVDHWGSFSTEANELKVFLEEENLAGSTVIVSGDLQSGGGLDGGCNSRFNVAELSVPHTNLKEGNTKAVGYWTEGIRNGSHKGYGSIIVTPQSLTLESRAASGNRVHRLTLPGSYNTDGCVPGPQQCSDNFATFHMPTSGDCAKVVRGQIEQAPFVNMDGGDNLIANEVTWYRCPDSEKVVMKSNGIPEHPIVISNPNKPCVQDMLAEFPLNPMLNIKTDNTLGKTETDNILGFALNGVVAFSAREAGANAVEPDEDATLLEYQHRWSGHGSSTAQHVWHYRSLLGFLGTHENFDHSSKDLLGVAMDGFPIYGPLDNEDAESVLDECNFDRPNKRYHVRRASQVNNKLPYCNDGDEAVNWKYIIGCYRGDLVGSALKNSLVDEVPGDCISVNPLQLFKYTVDYDGNE